MRIAGDMQVGVDLMLSIINLACCPIIAILFYYVTTV